jgi:hypothetical protein
MLSSRFLALSFLYLFYAARLVVADPLGGGQFCENVRTVTVVSTVTPNQPPPSSSPANNANPPPVVTQRPGNINLGPGGNNNNKNGNIKPSSTNNKNNNTKTSSTVLPIATPPVRINNGDDNQGNNGDDNQDNNGDDNQDNNPGGNQDNNPGGNQDNNPNTSPQLDPTLVQNINGKGQAANEADSLVSTNNFINVCLGKTLSNGKQVKEGSCNPTPMGDIPSVENMPSAKFTTPGNFDTIPPNTPFTISLKLTNLVPGTFTNPANTYFAAPQQLINGLIKGHSHVTVQQMTSLDSTDTLDPKVFAFFKGLNDAGNNGVLSTDVVKGLPAGVYRISSIIAAANHQEASGPVAQRGSFNDVIYITVANGGQGSKADPPTDVPSSVLSSSLSSPAVSPTSSIPPDVSSTTSPPLPTGTDGKDNDGKNDDGKNNDGNNDRASSSEPPAPTGNGKNDDGKNNGKDGDGKNDDGNNDGASSSEPPVPTNDGGKNGNKGGDPASSSPPSPTPTPTEGNDKTNTEDPAVPSSAAPPDSTSKGDKDPQGGNSKRMNRRSNLA